MAEYDAGPYKGYGKKIQEAFAAIVPDNSRTLSKVTRRATYSFTSSSSRRVTSDRVLEFHNRYRKLRNFRFADQNEAAGAADATRGV
jgi:hypothetical protein